MRLALQNPLLRSPNLSFNPKKCSPRNGAKKTWNINLKHNNSWEDKMRVFLYSWKLGHVFWGANKRANNHHRSCLNPSLRCPSNPLIHHRLRTLHPGPCWQEGTSSGGDHWGGDRGSGVSGNLRKGREDVSFELSYPGIGIKLFGERERKKEIDTCGGRACHLDHYFFAGFLFCFYNRSELFLRFWVNAVGCGEVMVWISASGIFFSILRWLGELMARRTGVRLGEGGREREDEFLGSFLEG